MTTPPINLAQYFGPLPNAPQPQPAPNPGMLGRLWNGAAHYSGQAVQGLADQLSTVFTNNQDAITTRVRDIFNNALLRRCPENYHRLQHLVQTFLNQPTSADLLQIKQLLNGLNAAEIRTMAPNILDAGVNALTTLRALLDVEVVEGPPLTVSQNARNRLQAATGILTFIINTYEGVLVQALNPQQGFIPETLSSLRRTFNARVHPPLRQAKDALENYRNVLQRNGTIAEIIPLMQTLHDKLALLLSERDPVPQVALNQWTQLEQFDRQLLNVLNVNAPLASHAYHLWQSDAPLQIISAAFNAQRGILEEGADTIVDGAQRGINRIYQNFFPEAPQAPQPPAAGAPAAGAPAAGTSPAAAPGPGGNPINLNTIVDRGRRFLDSILSSAGGAFAQQATRQLATLARYIFEKIREHIQNSPDQQHLLQTIDPMIRRLQGASDQSSWQELTGVVGDAFRFMQEQQVYLQGLRLPLNPVRTHVSAIPAFLHNIDTHQNSLQPLSQRAPQTVTDNDILQKASLLKTQASSKGPAKFILEKICGFKSNNAGYGTIYAASGLSEKKAAAIFRRRLFARIDQAELSLFSGFIKWSAKRMYDFFLPISSFFVSSTFDNMLKFAKGGIRDESIVKLARNWLAVTSGAYNQVALSPASEAKDFNAMMEDAIKAPERNGGLTPRELYAAVAKTAIDTFGPQIKFNEAIDRSFNMQIPSSSSLHFLNPAVALFNRFCSFALKTLLFIPQWLGNFVLKSSAKIALKFTPALQETAEQTIESLRRNTPASYAAQRLLYRQLQKVLQILQRNLNDDASATDGMHSRDTNIKKVEIANLVDYLLEVLNKSQYRTQDRLKNHIRQRGPLRDRAAKEIEDTFVPEVMEHIVRIMSTSLKSMTQEAELKQMLYDGLCIASDSFEDPAPVSDQDFAVVEKGIRELADQILETTIFYAIDEKFDFTNEKQKRAITQFMTSMKEQSQSFAGHIHTAAHEISQDGLSATALMDKVTSMINRSSQFNRERVDALAKADGNRNFHTETKYHLNEISRNLLGHCNPITERLNGIKTNADQALYLDRLIDSLSLSSQCNRTFGLALQNLKLLPQDMSVCYVQLSSLQQQLARLRQQQCPLPLADEIQRSVQELATSLQKIQEMQKAEEILRTIYPLFNRLKLEKQRNSSSSALNQLQRQLRQLINTLPSVDQKNRLSQRVGFFMSAQNREAIEQRASRFLSLYAECNSQNFAEENTHFQRLRRTHEALHPLLTNAIQDFTGQSHIHKTAIQSGCPELTRQVDALNALSQAQHDLPIWNLFIFDMQWATETVKNLAFDRAHSKIKQLFESLYQRHNYIGLINQGALLPFLEKFGKHHLKK